MDGNGAMNDLESYFNNNPGRLIHKWRHYFEIYERHFARFRSKPITLVEIGVYKGGSLQMWKHYFGPQARIIGVDIDPQCAAFCDEQVEIAIGSQEDPKFLRSLADRLPPIDILIDDGGHTMSQQITTFEELFPRVAANGVYLCEDLHTSYWPTYGGGYRSPHSYIEYSKNFIDYINAWHAKEPEALRSANRERVSRESELSVSAFTRSVHSLHYYDSVLVIEKRPMTPPVDLVSEGKQTASSPPRV